MKLNEDEYCEKSLTIVLPTFNEGENLQILVPNMIEVFSRNPGIGNFEIIVVDDGSTDDTKKILETINNRFSNIFLIERHTEPSLPKSIQAGILAAQKNLIVWLDADGSMPVNDIKRIWEEFDMKKDDVIIGSRFVVNGGFKGITPDDKNSTIKIFKNLHRSQDSIIAVLLSRLLNLYLRFVLPVNIKDMTSGFLMAKSNVFEKIKLSGVYGDYFPKIVWEIKLKKFRIREVGYFCIPRIYGESKTGTSIFKLIYRGIPYLTIAAKCRFLALISKILIGFR